MGLNENTPISELIATTPLDNMQLVRTPKATIFVVRGEHESKLASLLDAAATILSSTDMNARKDAIETFRRWHEVAQLTTVVILASADASDKPDDEPSALKCHECPINESCRKPECN